jgi:hypothetical protein
MNKNLAREQPWRKCDIRLGKADEVPIWVTQPPPSERDGEMGSETRILGVQRFSRAWAVFPLSLEQARAQNYFR